jgi:hypothetical protein
MEAGREFTCYFLQSTFCTNLASMEKLLQPNSHNISD